MTEDMLFAALKNGDGSGALLEVSDALQSDNTAAKKTSRKWARRCGRSVREPGAGAS